jgi:hypothetical protein
MKQPVLSFTKLKNEDISYVANFLYNHSKVRELATHMILGHEYPLLMMDPVIFNMFMKVVSPFYQKIDQNTVKKYCILTYENEKKKS